MPAESTARLRKLVFLHLQKTAGTSFTSALGNLFPPEQVCPERHNYLQHWKKSDLGRYRFFAGHFKYDALREIPGPMDIVTVLREPMARVLSHYYFVQSHTAAALEANDPDMAQVKGMPLIEYLRAGAPGLLPMFDQIGRGDLRLAKSRVRGMAAIGLVEKAEQSLTNIRRRLGLGPVGSLPRENITGERVDEPPFEPTPPRLEPITPEIQELLRAITYEDQRLYAFARRLFAWQSFTLRPAH